MPIEIESVTTEVVLPDRDAPVSPQQMERIVSEVFRRLELKLREDKQLESMSSFGGSATRRG
jgi:hypothetical protein